jgi:hypothetical protein
MSITDFDYEMEKLLGQAEYSVELARARTPEEITFVAKAFTAGQLKERERILAELEPLSKHGTLSIALFKLRKIINND